MPLPLFVAWRRHLSPGRGKSFHSGGGFGRGEKFTVYRLISSAVDRCGRNLLVLPRALPSGELSPQATERVRPESSLFRQATERILSKHKNRPVQMHGPNKKLFAPLFLEKARYPRINRGNSPVSNPFRSPAAHECKQTSAGGPYPGPFSAAFPTAHGSPGEGYNDPCCARNTPRQRHRYTGLPSRPD